MIMQQRSNNACHVCLQRCGEDRRTRTNKKTVEGNQNITNLEQLPMSSSGRSRDRADDTVTSAISTENDEGKTRKSISKDTTEGQKKKKKEC